MIRTGTTGFSDFREGGLRGLKLLYAALAVLPMQGLALARPVGLSYDPREVAAILRASDGIAVSSYIDWPRDAIEKLAADARRAKKIFAIHCSERVREEIDAVLDLKPAFLVHMIHATDADLERCADAHVPTSSSWISRVDGTDLHPSCEPPRAMSDSSSREDGSGLHRARRCETRR